MKSSGDSQDRLTVEVGREGARAEGGRRNPPVSGGHRVRLLNCLRDMPSLHFSKAGWG